MSDLVTQGASSVARQHMFPGATENTHPDDLRDMSPVATQGVSSVARQHAFPGATANRHPDDLRDMSSVATQGVSLLPDNTCYLEPQKTRIPTN